MSVSVSWFCYCDDCGERIDDGEQSCQTGTAARRSAAVHGAAFRKARNGKMYDFCRYCIATRADNEDDSVPERPL